MRTEILRLLFPTSYSGLVSERAKQSQAMAISRVRSLISLSKCTSTGMSSSSQFCLLRDFQHNCHPSSRLVLLLSAWILQLHFDIPFWSMLPHYSPTSVVLNSHLGMWGNSWAWFVFILVLYMLNQLFKFLHILS